MCFLDFSQRWLDLRLIRQHCGGLNVTWNGPIKIKRSQQRSVALMRDHTVYSTTLFPYVLKEGDIVFRVNDPFFAIKPLYGCLFRFILRIKCLYSLRILFLYYYSYLHVFACCFSCRSMKNKNI